MNKKGWGIFLLQVGGIIFKQDNLITAKVYYGLINSTLIDQIGRAHV